MLWNRFWGRFYLIKIDSFSAHISMPKLDIEDFVLYFSDLWSYKCLIECAFKISAWVWQKQQLQTHCGHVLIFLGKSLYKDILFLCPQWGFGPYISKNNLYEHILWMHLEKNRTYACTFPVQRKEINVVKVRLPWGILLENQVMRRLNNHSLQLLKSNCLFIKRGNVLLLGKKIFEIPPFF